MWGLLVVVGEIVGMSILCGYVNMFSKGCVNFVLVFENCEMFYRVVS